MTTLGDHAREPVAGRRPGPRARVALASCRRLPAGTGGEGLLAAALADRGVEARWVAWDDPAADWASFDAVVIRTTWDYTERLDDFRSWVLEVAVATTLLNPPRLVLDNLHKSYLAGMEEAVPTVVVPAGMTVEVDRLPWPRLVVKPAVAVGGAGAVRDAGQADLDALTLVGDRAVDAVVQPFVDTVESRGETSVVCIDGTPTHAVRKVPAAGEFRANGQRGAVATPEPLTARHAGPARRALAGLPARPAYARVDLLEVGDDLWVSELELVEPYLWLEVAPAAVDRLADCVVARIGAPAR